MSALPESPAEQADQLGDFRLVREIGRGGMGVVYEAEQVSLGRRVALKVLPPTVGQDPSRKARFEREARAAAKLHHTNIVQVFGVGEHNGQPYYVMQLIQGQGLDAVLARSSPPVEAGTLAASPSGNGSAAAEARPALQEATVAASPVPGTPGRSPEPPPASPRSVAAAVLGDSSPSGSRGGSYWHSVARIGAQVADALDYAHRQGVLHRDIKPSNLLLDDQGTVWVADFGLAKTEDQASLTQAGELLGTFRYMPPEAFEGQADRRTDIYSLGLTLYELLTQRPAYEDIDAHKIVKQVMTTEPARLNRVNPAIPRDLVTIVHKAADRDPGRRYQTAGELAEDLQRFLADEPIHARRQTPLERYARWARRHPGIAVLGGVLTAVLVATVVASLLAAGYFNRAAQNERDARYAAELAQQAAEESADEARRPGAAERWERYRSNIAAAGSALQLQSSGAARRALDAAPPEYRDWEWLHFTSRLDEARLVLPVGKHILLGAAGKMLAVRPDGKQVAVGWDNDGTVHVLDVATGREIRALPGQGSLVENLAYSPDGHRLLVFSQDGTLQSWDPATNDRQVLLQVPYGVSMFGDTLSPDHRLLVGVKDHAGQLWDIATGHKRADLPGIIPRRIGGVMAFSSDGRRLAYTTEDLAIHLWDLVAGAETHVLRGHSSGVRALAFSPDGKRLASGSIYAENTARLWDVATGKEIVELRGHRNEVGWVAFSADGTRLATASLDQTARLWDGVTGTPIATLQGHRGRVTYVVFRPDGKRLVTSSFDGTLRLWDAAAGEPLAVLHGHAAAVWPAAFSPDGGTLASAGNDGTLRLWDMALAERSGVLRGHLSYVYDVAFSPDGTRAASAAWDGTVRLWDPTSCLQTRPPLLGPPAGALQMVIGVCFRPDGKQIASANADGQLRVWDVASGQLLRTLRYPGEDWRQYPRAAFHPDGTMLAAGGTDGIIRLWGPAGDDPVATLAGHESTVGDVAFRPDGAQLASCGLASISTVPSSVNKSDM